MAMVRTDVPAAILQREAAYVAGATGFWSRLYRAARAAWRCASIAARARAAK